MKISVYGTPGPQGSKRHVGNGIMLESSKKVAPWRQAVKWAAIECKPAEDFCFHGPVRVEMFFTLQKPKSASKTRQTYPDKKPDLDKLIRSTNDALSESGIWEDDARVVTCLAAKVFPGEHEHSLAFPGVVIFIEPIT